MNSLISRSFDVLWRALVIAVGYVLALLLGGVLLGMLGLLDPSSAANVDFVTTFGWMFVGALLMGVTAGVAARQVAASAPRHLLIWSALLFCNIGAVIIEGHFFAPDMVGSLGPSLAQQVAPCLVSAWLVYRLFARAATTPAQPVARRAWHSWLWRLGLSAATYFAAYWLFGALNYALITGPYYEAQGTPLAVPDPRTVLVVEALRAVLIVLALLPFLLTAQMPVRRLALWSGMLLFIVGGIVPLTWQAGTLPLPLLAASAVEIFLQNFTTGAVAALLIGAPTAAVAAPRLRPA